MDINELLSNKYSLNEKDIEEALRNEEILEVSKKIDGLTMTENDEQLREKIYSYLSRREGNGIYVSVYRGVDKYRCKKEGIRNIKNIAEDILFRVKEAGLEPDDYLSISNEMLLKYKEYKYVIPEKIAQNLRFMFDVNYGGCEGMYYDLFLLDNNKEAETHMSYMITGKTLCTDDKSFLKMSYMGSYINLLLKSDGYKINISE